MRDPTIWMLIAAAVVLAGTLASMMMLVRSCVG